MSLAATLPHVSTKYWQLKQCQRCGIPFDPYAEHPSQRPPLPPRRCAHGGGPPDSHEWTCPYCVLVHRQHEEFPITLKGESLRHVVSNMEQRTGSRPGPLSNPTLTGQPFSAVPEHRSLLKDVLRTQRAVEWLAECPLLTLRVLQQRVLCNTETFFKSYLGLPSYLKPVDSPPTPRSDDGSEEGGSGRKEEFISPPAPITFSKFLSDFLVVEYDSDSVGIGCVARHDHPPAADDAAAPLHSSAEAHSVVLSTGRPAPVAPVTSANLVYGPQEEALRSSAESTRQHRKYTQATTTCSADRDPVMMNEIMHWSNFFHTHFDEKKEGQCRDPLFLFIAILIACAAAGRKVAEGCTEAQLQREIERQCLQHPSTHWTRCEACQEVRHRIRSYWRYQLERTAFHPQANPKAASFDESTGVRFFLGTPAVVLWAAAFLQLYRTTTSTVWKKDDGAPHGDTIRPGEVYIIRDWIARQAAMDEEGFERQKSVGSVWIPSSCSTNAKAYRVRFTKENVAAALAKISTWADQHVTQGTPLEVKELKEMLRTEFPTVAYYMTFFDLPVTCRHTRKRQPKHWSIGEGVVLKDPAVRDEYVSHA